MEGRVEKSEVFSGGYEGRRKPRVDLDQRYGEIGISAVAAAVRYHGTAKQAAGTCQDGEGAAEQAA